MQTRGAVDLTNHFHTLLAFFLFLQKFHLSRNVAAILLMLQRSEIYCFFIRDRHTYAFSRDIFSQR